MDFRRTLACVLIGLVILIVGIVAGTPDYFDPSVKWYTAFKRPEGMVVVVGIATLIVIAWQAYETRRAVEVSRDAAKSAAKNIETFVGRERARLEIIAGNVDMTADDMTVVGISYHVNNAGPSLAFIEDGGVALVVAPDKEIEVEYTKCAKMPFVGKVGPNARTPTQVFVVLQPKNTVTMDEALAIKNGQSFIHCYGFVKYRNVFDRTHFLRLHIRWVMRWGGMMEGQIMQWWEPVADPKETATSRFSDRFYC